MILFLKQLVCSHDNLLTKRVPIEDSDRYHMYTECLDCGKESPGIDIGGLNLGSKIDFGTPLTA